MSIWLYIIIAILLLYSIFVSVLFYIVEKVYYKQIRELEEMLEEDSEENARIVNNMKELFKIFNDFLHISEIVTKKYDLIQYQDYILFLSKLHNICEILKELVYFEPIKDEDNNI